MGYYGKGKIYNDIAGLQIKRLPEHFIEQLTKSNTMEIWKLYNKMFDEKHELSKDLSNAMIVRSNSERHYQQDIEWLNYCSWTYTSQEFNNLLNLVMNSYYKKCDQLNCKRNLTQMEKYFVDIMFESCGFKYKFSMTGQLKVPIPIKTVYQELLRQERLRQLKFKQEKVNQKKVLVGG